MDEQVIQDLYNRAVAKGYSKSKEEFVNLLKSDPAVQGDNYAYVQSKGYQKSKEEFLGLVGGGGGVVEQKKKDGEEDFGGGLNQILQSGGLLPSQNNRTTLSQVEDVEAGIASPAEFGLQGIRKIKGPSIEAVAESTAPQMAGFIQKAQQEAQKNQKPKDNVFDYKPTQLEAKQIAVDQEARDVQAAEEKRLADYNYNKLNDELYTIYESSDIAGLDASLKDLDSEFQKGSLNEESYRELKAEAANKKAQSYDQLENKYLDILKEDDPKTYKEYSERRAGILEDLKKAGYSSWDDYQYKRDLQGGYKGEMFSFSDDSFDVVDKADQIFLRKFRIDAINQVSPPDKNNEGMYIPGLGKGYKDEGMVRSFHQSVQPILTDFDALMLENKTFEDDYTAGKYTGEEAKAKYKELKSKENDLSGRLDQAKKDAEITDYDIKRYEVAARKQQTLGATFYEGFKDLKRGEDYVRTEQENRQRWVSQNPVLGTLTYFVPTVWEAFSDQTVVALAKSVKPLTETVGLGEGYGWTDALYYGSKDFQENRQALYGYSGQDINGDGEADDLPGFAKYGNVLGQGVGSMLAFAVPSSAASKTFVGASTAMRSARFATNWASGVLMMEGTAYDEALAAGLTGTEAAQSATLIATLQSAAESIVPDVAYLESSVSRAGILSMIKAGVPKKQIFENGMKYIGDLALTSSKSAIKEGGEEAVGQFATDIGKSISNDAFVVGVHSDINNPLNPEYSTKPYDKLWEMKNYTDAAIGGALTGGFIKMLGGATRVYTKNEMEALSYMGQNYKSILTNVQRTASGRTGKNAENFDDIEKDLKGIGALYQSLKAVPGFKELTKANQDVILSLAFKKKSIQDNVKNLGVELPSVKQQLAEIDEKIEAYTTGKLDYGADKPVTYIDDNLANMGIAIISVNPDGTYNIEPKDIKGVDSAESIKKAEAYIQKNLKNPTFAKAFLHPTAKVETTVNLTEQEQNRKTELETAIAKESGKGTVTIGGALIPIEEAQAELDALNEKTKVETPESIEAQRKAELEDAFNKDILGDWTEPGSDETIGEAINRKYDEKLAALNQEEKTTPTEKQVPTILATAEATTLALEALPENERSGIKFTQEDGTETPVMGNEKMLAELFQQAQAVPEADRTDFHQNIIDAVTLSLSDQIEQEQVQMQEQEQAGEQPSAFEDYSDDDMITFEVDTLEDVPEQFRDIAYERGPQEITARKKILGLPVGKKQVVKRKGKTFQFGISGRLAKANAKNLETVRIVGLIESERSARATTKAQLFTNVSKSLASIFPNVGIRNFKNNEEMKAYVDSKYKDSPVSKQIFGNEGGMIIYDEKGKPSEIIINDKTSTATTLPHEVWHAILVKAFGENEALFKEFRDEIRKTLVQNGFTDIVGALDKFSSSPEYKASNKQAQEWLVEFGGLLTASGVTMENIKKPEVRNLLNQIKDIFNKIAMEMIGEPIFLDYATTRDILDFMVSMSNAMSRGENISTYFDSKRPDTKTTGATATVSKQTGKGNPAEEVRRIAQRYNVNNSGFAPSQINEFALDKELRPYGYSAKRAAPDGSGKQRGVYILNPKGRFYNPFKGKFQKVSSQTTQTTEPKVSKNARAKQIYNTETLVNKLAQLTGMSVKYINDPAQMFKGKIEDRVATINMAYVTADTPIHEILGHPVIASLKETDRAFYDKLANEVKNSKQGASILARIKQDYSEYSEEQQVEEAIVEMLSLMVSNRLENNSTLKRMLTKLLQDIIGFINKNFKTKFGESDVINMRSLSKDIENYINQTEGAFNKSIDDLVNLFLTTNTSTYLSVNPNEITADGRKILEKKYGETIGRSVASSISNAPLYADLFVKFVDNLLVDPSQAKAFLSSETNLSYVNYFFDQHINPNQKTEKLAKVFKDPFELISPTGYQLHPVTELQHFETFRKDYDKGYTICTYATAEEPGRRLGHSFIFWIRKPYASDILPYNMLTQEYLQSDSADAAEWRAYLKSKGLEKKDGTYEIPLRPSIYDPYAVSSISLQIARDPRSSFQKMVNRYNHHIDISKGGDGVADAAFKNKLDNIVKGLDDSVRNYVNLPIKVKSKYDYDTDNVIPVGDKLFVYESEMNNFFLSPQGFVKNNLYTKVTPDIEILADEFLFNKKTNTIISFGNSADFFEGADDVSFEKNKIIVKSSKYNYTTEIFLNDKKQIVSISSDTTRDISDNFFTFNNTIESIDLPNVQNIGSNFLSENRKLKSISLPNVNKIASGFLLYNQELTSLDLPKLVTVYDNFLGYNVKIESLNLPELVSVKNTFLTAAANITSVSLPKLSKVGDYFFQQARELSSLSLPMLQEAGDNLLGNNRELKYISLPELKIVGLNFLYFNNSLDSIDLPKIEVIGAGFLLKNTELKAINVSNLKEVGSNFLQSNNKIEAINLLNANKIGSNFMYNNKVLRAINIPNVEKIGSSFLFLNDALQFINAPKLESVSDSFLTNNMSLDKINIDDNIDTGNQFLTLNPKVDKYSSSYNPEGAIRDAELFAELNNKLGFERFSDLYSEFLKKDYNGSLSQFAESIGEAPAPSVSAQRDGILQESVEKIPGYDLMVEKSKRVALRTSRRFGADYDRIMNAVMQYVRGSNVYELADDSQREQLERNVRADFGKKEKAAPSPTKVFELPTVVDLFGAIEDVKMITMTELQLLNEQMKALARGGKDAKMSWMAVSKQVAKQVKELALSGKITNRQAASVISRLAMVNMFNQDSIDKFTEYMAKVFNDANYDMKIEKARKKLPRALKNLKKKIGIANAVAPSLVQLFSINPNLIPDSVLETYLELVEMFGSSDSVLNLGDIDLVAEDTKAILDAVNDEVSSTEELALRFEEFDDKVYDEDGKLDYAKTIAKMLDREAIDDAEAEIMRKYKNIIFPKVKEAEKTAAEIEEEKKALIKAIKSVTVDIARLPTRLERDLAKRLVALLKPELLKKLSVNQLENVSKLIDNINAGYLPRYAMITVEKLNSVQSAANDLETAITDGKALRVSGFISKIKAAITGRTAELEMIRRSPLVFIDQIFGDFKTKRIFNAVFGMMAQGQAAFDTDISKVNKKLDNAHDAVAKSHRYNANATLESSFRMMAYMIQLEYESNLGSDQVNPASSFINATIKRMLNDKTNKFKERDAALLENILDEYGVDVGVDKKGKPIREIDINKLYASFNEAEIDAIKTIREINDGLTDKAQYTASIIRGESITPLNNYVHLPVLHDYDPNERSTGIQNSNAYNNSRRASTKAKTLEGRTGEVSPINFDVFASAQKGAKATLLDFHLTEAIRTSRKTINETRVLMEEKGTLRGSKRALLNAIESANEEVIRNVLTNNFITDSFGDAVINEVSKQGYRAILASSKRFVSELASNVGFVLFTDPKAFAQGIKYRATVMSPSAINVMSNVSSKQTSRLFSGNSLTGRFIDTSILGQASGVRSAKVKGGVQNTTNQAYNYSLKYIKNGVEFVADGLISTPDKLVMRPVWFGAFANEFKKQTGAEVDFDKIAANDEAYMSQHKDAISKARDAADEKSTLTGATDNPFMGILKGAVTADQSGWTRGYNNFNNFMTRFAIYEFAAARQGIYAAMGDGTLTRKQGAALLAGVITRMTVYTLLTNVLGSMLLSAFGDDDEEETEKSFMQKFEQALASTATSLLVGRDFGNTVKLFSNVGVEKINEKYFDFLRNGDYDPYEDAISYSAIPKERKGHQTDLGDYGLIFTGSFTPLAKTVDLAIRKAHEDPKKEAPAIQRQKAEIYQRLPIEMLGHMGLIPMYNEVRGVLMSQIYSSLEQEIKAEKVSEKERAIEKVKLGKYETRTDMKRYDPELYEKTFGPGSPGYDADQAKKKLAEEKGDAKRAEKDKYFGYQESYTDRVDREDRERIEKIKESPNYDPNAVPTKDLLTRSELKKYFPEDYEKKYGEDSEYYKEKEPETKEQKIARDKRKAVLDAAYGVSTGRGGASTGRGSASTGRGSASTGRGSASTGRGGASTGRGSASTGRGK